MTNVATWQTDYDGIITVLAPQRCGVLVNVNPLTDVVGDGTVTAEQVNAYLTQEVTDHPNFRLVDWVAAIAVDPTLVSTFDGIHPSAAGSQWLADHYKQALDSC